MTPRPVPPAAPPQPPRTLRGCLLSLVLLLGAPPGCSVSCGDVGCLDTLEVWVDGVTEFSLTVRTPGGHEATRACPESCLTFEGSKVVFFEGDPRRVEVVVRDPQGREILRRSALPAYRDNRPNGPSCPPTCRTGTIRIEVPPAA